MSNQNDITPLPAVSRTGSLQHIELNEKDQKQEISHIEDDEATIRGTGDSKPHYTAEDAKHSVGLALIDQVNAIPSAGERIVTTKKEYWSYVAFGECFIAGELKADISDWRSWDWNRNIWRYHSAGFAVSAIPRWTGRVGRKQHDVYVHFRGSS